MKNFNTFTFFNQLTAMPKRLAMLLTVLFTLGVGSMLGAETYSWTCTGSTTFSTSGSSLNGVTWKASTSGTSQGTGVAGEKCVQIAKNTGLTLETTFFKDKNITSISIQTWGSQENTFSLQDDNTQLATTTIPKSYTSNAAKITFSNVGTVKTKLVFKWESASKAFNVRSINITYEDAAPSCDKKVTLTKGSETNGTFTLDKANGSYDNCDEDFVVKVSNVVPKSSSQYCSGVNVTGGNSTVTGPVDGVWTVTYAKGNNITSTITPTFADKIPANISFENMGNPTPITTGYYVGDTYTLPATNDYICGDKTFVGWSTEIIENSATKPTAATYFEPGASVTLGATNKFYAVFAEGDGAEILTSITGGDWPRDASGDWLTSGTETYNGGNGVKFNHANDYVMSPDISSNNYTELLLKFKSGHNGGEGSVLTFYAYDVNGTWLKDGDVVIKPETIVPTDSYTSQNTIYEVSVSASEIIGSIMIMMTSKKTNLGMKYCELFGVSSSFQNYTTTCKDESEYINVTGVTISNSELALKVGEKQTLTATIAPANATNKNLIWTSNNNSIASVGADGLVTAISAGTATITVKTEVGGFAATCAVYVTEPVTPVEGVYYELTDLADIKPTDVVLFVGKVGDKYYAMSNDETGGKGQPLPVEVTVVGDKITTTAENVQWIISKLNDDIETITFYSVTKEKWLCCENDNNGLRLKLNAPNNTFKRADNGYLYNNEQGRTIGIYNKQDWRSYSGVDANIKDQTFGFYVKHSSNPLISVTPDTYDFGLVEVNKSASITLTIVSEHVTDLKATITDNTNYSIGQITNAPDGNKQIKITYNPKDEKIHYATLTIVSTNASEGANFEIALLGQGVISDGAVWTLVEDVNDLQIGDKVVIAAAEYDYALSTTQNTNNRGAVAIVKDNKTILVHPEVQIITLEVGTSENSWAFNVGGGYLYADQSTENYLRTKNGKDAYGSWVISITDGVTSIVGQGGNTRETLRFNDNNRLFSCYGDNTNQKSVAIYKKQVHIRNVTRGDYGTICIPYGSNNYTGAEFYEISWMEMNGATPKGIWLDQVNGALTAGKPYIFKATADEIAIVGDGTTAAAPAAGEAGLVGTFKDIKSDNTILEGNYMISGNQFLLCPAGCWLNAYRAYIDAGIIAEHTNKKAEIPGRRRVCLGENVSTGFENVTNGENTTIKVIQNGQLIIIRNGVKYNVQGQRL